MERQAAWMESQGRMRHARDLYMRAWDAVKDSMEDQTVVLLGARLQLALVR